MKIHLFGHDAADLAVALAAAMRVVLLVTAKGSGHTALLLRELEANVLFVDGGSHGCTASLISTRTKHEAGSKLRAPSGADGLILLGKSCETRSDEALGL